MNKSFIIVLGFLVVVLVIYISLQYKGELTDEYKQQSPITIKVLAGQSTTDAGIESMITKAVLNQFENVTLEWEVVDWGEQFDNIIRTRFVSGDIPDIIIGKVQDVDIYREAGMIMPIIIDGTDRIYDNVLDQVMVESKLYGLPYNSIYQGVLYNKQLFDSIDMGIPKNSEELFTVIDAFKDKNITPFATHYREPWYTGNITMQFMLNNVFLDQPNWGEDFRAGNTQYMTDIAVKKAYKENMVIWNNTWDDALYLDQNEADIRFANGEAAMYVTGSWSLQGMNNITVNDQIGIFPYPNATGDALLIRETNMTFMKSAYTNHSEIIDDIIQFIFNEELLMREVLEFTHSYPVSVLDKSSIQSSIEEDIDNYVSSDKIIEASVGNNQLIWRFQEKVTTEVLKWLKGEQSFESVLMKADELKITSGY